MESKDSWGGKNSETRKTGRSQKRFKSVIQTLLRGEKQMTSCQHLRSSFTPTRGMNSKNIHPLMFSSSKSTQDPYLKVFIFSDLHIKLKAHSQGSNNSYPFTLDSHLKIINDQFKFPQNALVLKHLQLFSPRFKKLSVMHCHNFTAAL